MLRKDAHLLRHLATFEVACRLMNFSRVAEQMGVSRVAVSRQIAELEDQLGHKLFLRSHRRLSLTSAGRTLSEGVGQALGMIADTLQRLRGETSGRRLSVTTTTAFATHWLMPRLADFGLRHPDVDIDLIVSETYLDLAAEEIDVAIRYAPSRPAYETSLPLTREWIFPVFSPAYVRRTPMLGPEDLAHERLLLLRGNYRPEAGWAHWFRQFGLAMESDSSGIVVNTYSNMLQAALHGQGVALAGTPLVDQFLADGSLIKLDVIPPYERDIYYLVNRSAHRPSASLFCDWLRGFFPA